MWTQFGLVCLLQLLPGPHYVNLCYFSEGNLPYIIQFSVSKTEGYTSSVFKCCVMNIECTIFYGNCPFDTDCLVLPVALEVLHMI